MIKRLLVAACGFGLIAAVAAFVISVYAANVVLKASNNAYRHAQTGEAIVAYLQNNDQQWPANWNSLQPYLNRPANEFSKHLTIDFEIDPKLVTCNPSPGGWSPEHFAPIQFRQQPGGTYENMNGNEIVYQYFIRHASSDFLSESGE